MFGRTARTALKTPAGRRAARSMAKGAFKAGRTRGGRGTAKVGVRGLGKLAKTGAKLKAGKEAGRVGAKGATKAGKGFGKLASRKGKREIRMAEKTLKSERSGGSRFLKFALLALAGLGIGAIIARVSGRQDSSATDTTGPHHPEPGSPAAERGETAGSGTPVGGTSGGTADAGDAGRAHSDPSSGPLIGESHQGNIEGVGEDQPEISQRIKTRVGEDERTRDMPRLNVEVIDGVAELRGSAPSDEAKAAAGEIAAEVEGVREVRNLISVSS